MNHRIKDMAERVLRESIYPEPKPIEYDKFDLLLPDTIMNTKRLCEYMLAQDVKVAEGALLAGAIRFDGSVPSDLFPRTGHKRFDELLKNFYCQPVDNFVTFEWQHSTPNYADVIENGIMGIAARIQRSQEKHKEDAGKEEFLAACGMMCDGIIAWEMKCSKACAELARAEENPVRKAELLRMGAILQKVPAKPADTFYEAVQSLYFCFDFLSDSIGTIDRCLYKYYKRDMEQGTLTREEAKALLQELFIRIQSRTGLGSKNFTRGGECHFAIGGYTAGGEDGYNELSDLIVDALMELPLFIPQISLRWTRKTPFDVLKKLMDCERNDPYKRIAFVNDEPRIKSFMENVGMGYEEAANYTMVGCNEPALQGGTWFGGVTANMARSLERTLHGRTDDILPLETFEDFYGVYREELYKDLAEIEDWGNKFNFARSKDENILSGLFLDGCIENGVSVTKGGATGIAGCSLMGLVTVIDSLAIIRQFVFDEKLAGMQDMLSALRHDWAGHEDLRTLILKKGRFFGNDDALADGMAERVATDLHRFFAGRTNLFGKRFLLGNLTGYNQHYTWFGANTKATPDGRRAGEPLSLGISQSGGKDREGLSALLKSVARFDSHGIFCGPSVTNVNLDAALLHDDEHFEKLAGMVETYFKMGGLHIQLNAVKRGDLMSAQKTPDQYQTLRVRVSGFSDFFVNLNEDLQDNIIARTEIGG